MIKFVTGNKKLLLLINKIPVLKRFFVFDISRVNSIQEDSFYNFIYSHITVGDGSTKTTKSNRFSELDEITLNILKDFTEIIVHDVAVSNGITSLELWQKLNQGTTLKRFCMSDKFLMLFYKGENIKKIYDREGNLLTVNFFFFHLSPNIGNFFFISRFLFRLFRQKVSIDKLKYKEITLLAPRVYQSVINGSITLLDYDVFTTQNEVKFNFIRCMNLLMSSYFSEEKIKKGIDNISKDLAEDGILLIGRNDSNDVPHVTFFKKRNNTLHILRQLNDGFTK